MAKQGPVSYVPCPNSHLAVFQNFLLHVSELRLSFFYISPVVNFRLHSSLRSLPLLNTETDFLPLDVNVTSERDTETTKPSFSGSDLLRLELWGGRGRVWST